MPSSPIILIEIRFNLPGLHNFNRAAGITGYLSNQHRHTFNFVIKKVVNHTDRDVEFIAFSAEIKDYLQDSFVLLPDKSYNFEDKSCEDLALLLFEKFDLFSCWVYEDNEYGGGIECY